MIAEQKQNNKRLMILAEMDDERSIAPITLELLRAGRALAEKKGGIVCTAVLGGEVKQAAHEIARFSDEVYCIENASLDIFQADLYVDALEQLCRSIEPETILLGHTTLTLELAPKLAFRMGSDLISDCAAIDLDTEGERLVCAKPVFGDNAVAVFTTEKKPGMATLRSKAVEPVENGIVEGKIIDFKADIDASNAQTELIETVRGENNSLDKADAVVSGGRGIKSVEDLGQLDELAKALLKYFDLVEVGASRPVVDAGWLPSFRQIGLTGEKISPDLYIAVGISGSLQHLSGVFGAKKIVAINNDPGAGIFNYADFGVVGAYEDVLPSLIAELKELQ